MNNAEIKYTKVGELLFPNLSLDEAAQMPLGKWGLMRKTYLMEHREPLYMMMLTDGSLWEHLQEIDRSATEMYEQMMASAALSCGATENLKATDPMKWVGLMNTTKAQVEEVILHDLIYS